MMNDARCEAIPMKVISTTSDFSTTFQKLLRKHDYVDFATAWASSHTRAFSLLHEHRAKIRRGVIGTHFYQTCPGALAAFVDTSAVRYVRGTDGVFHPKAYLFESDGHWDALVGSANFTVGALEGRNRELLIHLSAAPAPDASIADDLRETIREFWEGDGRPITQQVVDIYARLYEVHAERRERLAGCYAGENRPARSRTSLAELDWNGFAWALRNQVRSQEFSERLGVLDSCHQAFSKGIPFSKLTKDERTVIAGLPSRITKNMSDPAWFGSMRGAGWFNKAVTSGHSFADAALEAIPREGMVDRATWLHAMETYSSEVRHIAPHIRNSLGTFSRLVAMKRPDLLLCATKNNQRKLKEQLGLERTCMTADDFWNLVVRAIHDTVWWNSPEPDEDDGRRIWRYRAALLDALVYVGDGPPGRT